ncbi:MAG TPA: hypothetical protein VD816_10560 [Ohtaekwangia sp.]|nr:hypothetical protein [Ohtaekwangia sp.]
MTTIISVTKEFRCQIFIKENIPRYAASVPAQSTQFSGGHIKIEKGRKKAVLKCIPRKGADGDEKNGVNEVYIAPNIVKWIKDGEIVTASSTTEREYKSFKRWHDKKNVFAIIGFAILIISTLVDGSVKLGEDGHGFIEVSRWTIGVLKYLTFFLTAIGVIILFAKERAP